MKLKELITKVKAQIAGFIARLTKTAREVIPVGIEVVNLMKTLVDSKYVDILTALTPTNADENAVKALRVIIPKVLKKLEGWNDKIQASENEILNAVIQTINSYPDEKRHAMQLTAAAMINMEMASGAITLAESITATHEAYNNPKLLTA